MGPFKILGNFGRGLLRCYGSARQPSIGVPEGSSGRPLVCQREASAGHCCARGKLRQAIGEAPGQSYAIGEAPGQRCAIGKAPDQSCAIGKAPDQSCAIGKAPGKSCAIGKAPG